MTGHAQVTQAENSGLSKFLVKAVVNELAQVTATPFMLWSSNRRQHARHAGFFCSDVQV